MTLKEKALELSIKFCNTSDLLKPNSASKIKAIICVKNEYHSNRQLLLNLESGLEISERIYMYRIKRSLDEEQLLIEEIEKL